MPYKNEHSCRLEDPKKFQKNSFRRLVRGDADVIIARPKGSKKTRAQAIRYPIENWAEDAARESCQRHRGKFEPASFGVLPAAEIQAGAIIEWDGKRYQVTESGAVFQLDSSGLRHTPAFALKHGNTWKRNKYFGEKPLDTILLEKIREGYQAVQKHKLVSTAPPNNARRVL